MMKNNTRTGTLPNRTIAMNFIPKRSSEKSWHFIDIGRIHVEYIVIINIFVLYVRMTRTKRNDTKKELCVIPL